MTRMLRKFSFQCGYGQIFIQEKNIQIKPRIRHPKTSILARFVEKEHSFTRVKVFAFNAREAVGLFLRSVRYSYFKAFPGGQLEEGLGVGLKAGWCQQEKEDAC